MKFYTGKRVPFLEGYGSTVPGPAIVRVEDRTFHNKVYVSLPLDPCHGIANHSPDGFQWGYAGSGPSQLALAICVDHLGDVALARRVYQDFKMAVIALIKTDEWELSEEQVAEEISKIILGRSP